MIICRWNQFQMKIAQPNYQMSTTGEYIQSLTEWYVPLLMEKVLALEILGVGILGDPEDTVNMYCKSRPIQYRYAK